MLNQTLDFILAFKDDKDEQNDGTRQENINKRETFLANLNKKGIEYEITKDESTDENSYIRYTLYGMLYREIKLLWKILA